MIAVVAMGFFVVLEQVQGHGHDGHWLAGMPDDAIYAGMIGYGFSGIVAHKDWNGSHWRSMSCSSH